MEERNCTLFVAQFSSDRKWFRQPFAASLESILSFGIDFALFGTDELQAGLTDKQFIIFP
jgi:hypothetical protein